MSWYRCLIRGENFPGSLIGKEYAVGFFVTRFVESVNVAEAELAALEQLRAEPKLTLPSACEPSGNASVYFEEIAKANADEIPAVPNGFAWYPMKAGDGPQGYEQLP